MNCEIPPTLIVYGCFKILSDAKHRVPEFLFMR